MNQSRAKALVIVESPTKAKTIRKFLGDQYLVEASMGHVRDLPSSASEIPSKIKKETWARIGVNIDDAFQPVYVVPSDKKAQIKELKGLLKGVDELYIATDEDREGESIGWHLIEVLKPKVPIKRMVFHEITENAIQQAIANPRALDHQLVQAQETRRILDRLVGYIVSPQLWKKVASKLSAGRVQSAAVKLLVNRERERMHFHSGQWWDIQGDLLNVKNKDKQLFSAQLIEVDDQGLTQSNHFDSQTGQVLQKYRNSTRLLGQSETEALVKMLEDTPSLTVSNIERRETKKKPLPPFITSTLQQAANRRLGWSTSVTMRVAQRLYENGLITYMRTDAPALAQEAVTGIREAIKAHYGAGHVPTKAPIYKAKSKNAQEAHEAIRPAGTTMKTAGQLGLSGQDEQLYTLIWRRTMACQMNPALLSYTTVKLKSLTNPKLGFRSSGREVLNPGFMLAYDIKDEDEKTLPPLEHGDLIQVHKARAMQHFTKPPSRYNEASLVKALEQEGVGRPSTYASIIDTIQRRGYVVQNGRQLTPTFTGLAVTQMLEEAFSEIVDPEFTASMEEWLDQITTGRDHLELLKQFYHQQLIAGVERSESLDPRVICAVKGPHFPEYEVRVGRFGPFIEYQKTEEETGTLSLPKDINPDEITSAWIEERVNQAEQGEVPIGIHPTTKEDIYVREGRFGTYIQLGTSDKPKRSSLPKGLSVDELTLDQAVSLLDLPRKLGEHPETGKDILVNLGRYGAYAQHQRTYASLSNDLELFDIDFVKALKLVQDKEAGKSQSGPKVLKTLGEHPEGGEIDVLEGRYGPYVKHKKVNASLPKALNVEDITLEKALELLAQKASKTKGKTTAKSTKSKTTAKSTKSKTTKSKTATKTTKSKTATKTTKSKTATKTTKSKTSKK